MSSCTGSRGNAAWADRVEQLAFNMLPAALDPTGLVCHYLTSANSIDSLGLHTVYKGFKSRANIVYHFLPDALVYFTWSQGFRPGAFNRTTGCWIPNANGMFADFNPDVRCDRDSRPYTPSSEAPPSRLH